ncbi:MAG: HesA/MoeB/ThiF family protein [Thioalkalivibrionaceae bacterium]
MALTDDELLRYARQILLPEIDIAGQERLQSAKVLIVGMGGLGNPVASLLASAGIGRLTIVDGDVVDASNLARQTLFTTSDVGQKKVDAARHRIAAINPYVDVHAIAVYADIDHLKKWVTDHDLVIDATDRFAVRDTINLACWDAQKTWIMGAAAAWSGQTTTFDFAKLASQYCNAPGATESTFEPDQAGKHHQVHHHGCYRCLYGESPDDRPGDCMRSGVIATATHLIATLQANEAIRLLLGQSSTQNDRVKFIDLAQASCREIKRRRDPFCAICSNDATTAR